MENPKLTMSFLFLQNRFPIVCSEGSASDTLAGGMYLAGNEIDGNSNLMMIGKAAPQWCTRSSSATQSATSKIVQLGVSTFVPSRALGCLRRSNIRENRHGQNWSGEWLNLATR